MSNRTYRTLRDGHTCCQSDDINHLCAECRADVERGTHDVRASRGLPPLQPEPRTAAADANTVPAAPSLYNEVRLAAAIAGEPLPRPLVSVPRVAAGRADEPPPPPNFYAAIRAARR